ncbi:MAG: hypothetical protein R6U84_03470 [Candidatus Cloacimonadales bacterium]
MINPEPKLQMILQRHLPARLPAEEGELLKRYFRQIASRCDENSKEIYFKYAYDWQEQSYILTEEYLFRDQETVLDLKRAITKNFYLRRL